MLGAQEVWKWAVQGMTHKLMGFHNVEKKDNRGAPRSQLHVGNHTMPSNSIALARNLDPLKIIHQGPRNPAFAQPLPYLSEGSRPMNDNK